MFGYYCLVLVTVIHLHHIEASVVRHLPYSNAQKLPAVPEGNNLSGKNEYNRTRSPNLTSVRPSQNLMVQQAPAPIVGIEEGSYFEGDIILRPEQLSSLQKQLVGGKSHRALWPNGILYYDFSDEFHEHHKAIIERAIFDLQRETCVRFVRRTAEPTYILLRNTNRGCASQVGYHPTGQRIDLYLSSPGCLRTGTIQHEFLHALGFWHEHTRPDRDSFITILWNNIMPGLELNFRARSHFEPYEWLPYDYNSVMHYRAVAFSKDRLSATIVPKDNRAFFAIGQRTRLSPMDIAKLNALYNCAPNHHRVVDAHSLASEPEKVGSSEGLTPNTGAKEDTYSTTSEKVSLSKPETGIVTSSTKHEDNLFSKSVVENNTSLPKPEKYICVEGSVSEPGMEQEASSSEPEESSIPKLEKVVV